VHYRFTMISDNGWPIEKGRQGLSVWRLNRILAILQNRIQQLKEEGRELPIVWSSMHMYTTMQLAKILALKRGLDPELARLVGAFHDIYSILTGETENHAINAKVFIEEIIQEYNTYWRGNLPEITENEKNRIISTVENHSNKIDISNDSLTELLRDADSLDSYLHGFTPGRKTGRIPRVNRVLENLGIDHSVTR